MDDLFDLCDCGEKDVKSMPLIGDTAPEFTANTTNGKIKFPTDFAGKWVILFSHPSDFTPVCTSEFVAFQRELAEFEELNTKLVGLSIGALSSHLGWFDAIGKMPNGENITFPLIDDLDMRVASLYGMVHPRASGTSAVRAVFIIDPKGVIRAILYYPAILGRNIDEIKRMIIGLQTADTFGVSVPVNWRVGDDVLRPAPQTAVELRRCGNANPWFMTYKKLDKDVILGKIRKQKPGKK